MIIAVYIVLLLVGITFLFQFSKKLVKYLRLFFIKPIWESYPGTILESNGEKIMVDRYRYGSGYFPMFSTSIKVAYQINQKTIETFFYERTHMNASLSETKTTFKIYFPVGKSIPVYINAKDRSEIEIDKKKLKRNKIGLAFDILVYLIYISMGIAMTGLGIWGIYSQLK
jgi:hypothetical protein